MSSAKEKELEELESALSDIDTDEIIESIESISGSWGTAEFTYKSVEEQIKELELKHQQTIETANQLQEQLERLKAKEEERKIREIIAAIEASNIPKTEIVKQLGFHVVEGYKGYSPAARTTTPIPFPIPIPTPTPAPKAVKPAPKAAKTKLPPKYFNPANHAETWAGVGSRPPSWASPYLLSAPGVTPRVWSDDISIEVQRAAGVYKGA